MVEFLEEYYKNDIARLVAVSDGLNSIIDNITNNVETEEEQKDIEQLKKCLANIVEIIDKNGGFNNEEYKRTCSECSKEMSKGYCIENGMEYYCSDECLHKHYTQEEFEEMYDDGNGDSYYTEWED